MGKFTKITNTPLTEVKSGNRALMEARKIVNQRGLIRIPSAEVKLWFVFSTNKQRNTLTNGYLNSS